MKDTDSDPATRQPALTLFACAFSLRVEMPKEPSAVAAITADFDASLYHGRRAGVGPSNVAGRCPTRHFGTVTQAKPFVLAPAHPRRRRCPSACSRAWRDHRPG